MPHPLLGGAVAVAAADQIVAVAGGQACGDGGIVGGGDYPAAQLQLGELPVQGHVPGLGCHPGGEIRQDGSTADMVSGVAELIAYISQVMTLEPGDVILTGTPSGVGPCNPAMWWKWRLRESGPCVIRW